MCLVLPNRIHTSQDQTSTSFSSTYQTEISTFYLWPQVAAILLVPHYIINYQFREWAVWRKVLVRNDIRHNESLGMVYPPRHENSSSGSGNSFLLLQPADTRPYRGVSRVLETVKLASVIRYCYRWWSWQRALSRSTSNVRSSRIQPEALWLVCKVFPCALTEAEGRAVAVHKIFNAEDRACCWEGWSSCILFEKICLTTSA